MSTNREDLPQLKRALHALQQMRARLDAVERARAEPLAVVGMSCRFPGGAASPEAFWELLLEGQDGITEVPADRWDADALYDPDADAVGKLTTRWGGFIDGVDRFDPAFFGISPREAAQMDPQQRLLLEVAWEALENAGQPADRLAGSATGVFVGIHSHSNDYTWLQLREPEDVGTYSSTGTAHSIVANRLSYWLDLRGPSVAVDTACSSSLVAVHLAVQSLRARECDLALAGGVNLLLSPEVTAALSRMRMMASDGRCKTFDSRADGFVRGEGCGVVVLKRLSDALAGGDPILALIAGSAVNQDGATNGLTAPSGLAQREVVRRALADARVDPSHVSYVETHGTGTSLGDPIEVEALAEVLGPAGDSPCRLGAVKSNIGHLEGAAGIAGLIKTVLALQHGTIPPNLHFRQLNPHIALAGTRFEIPTAPRPWRAGSDRLAGVSSFGFGGTNAHVVLKQAPNPAAAPTPAAVPDRARVLPISAHNPAALRALAGSYAERLAGSPPPLDDLTYTASVRRTHHPHRLAVVGRSAAELRDALSAFLAGGERPDAPRGHADPEARRRLVWVFCGQGAQRPGMGLGLLHQEPVFRETLEACDRLLHPLAGWSLLDELAAPAERSRLDQTEVAQPAIFAIQVALAALWRSWGIVPDAVLGHSVGEVAAAHVAGGLSLEDAIRVIHHRGRTMQPTAGLGKMVAVGLSRSDAEAFLAGFAGGISLAAVNGPSSCVLSGDAAAVDAVVAALAERGVFARLLPVPHAFHSPQMEPVRDELVRALAGLCPRPGTVPLFSTVTGRLASPDNFDGLYWGQNLREPVLFADAVAAAAAAGFSDFLEIGPHPLLRTSLEQCAAAGEGLILGSLHRELEEPTALLQSLAALHTRGYAVAWTALHPSGGNVVPLPNYPWQRRRHWHEPAAGTTRRLARGAVAGRDATLPGRRVGSPGIRDLVFEGYLTAAVAAPLLLGMLLRAGREALACDEVTLEELELYRPLATGPDGDRIVQTVLRRTGPGCMEVEVHSRGASDAEDEPWLFHVRCTAVARTAAGATAAPVPPAVERVRERCRERLPDEVLLGTAAGPQVDGIWAGNGEALALFRPGASATGAQDARLLDTCLRLIAAGGHPGSVPNGLGEHRRLIGLDAVRTRRATGGRSVCHAVAHAGGESGELCGDALLCDEHGALVAEVRGARFAVRATDALAVPADRPSEWQHEVVWRETEPVRPAANGASSSPSLSGSRWLIVPDEGGLADAVAAVVRERGGACVVLTRAGDAPADAGDADAIVLYLAGLDAASDGAAGVVVDTVSTACADIAGRATGSPSGRLWVATRGAQRVRDDESVEPAQAALWGLGRCLALEHPATWGGLVDIGADGDHAAWAARLVDAIAAATGEDQLALRDGATFVPRLVRAAPARAVPPLIRWDGAYLVTGGLGAVGLRLARWLAEQGARHVVLLGRTPLPDRLRWSELERNSVARRRVTAIRAIERLGTRVTPVAADVADAAAMRRLVERFGRELPPLRGVFHAAGVIDLVAAHELTPERIAATLRPKVAGGLILHDLTRGLDLDLFVIFSSASAIWGSARLAHYAAANQFLDALAQHRAGLGLPALSVSWGWWEGGGTSAEADEFLGRSGLRPMAAEAAFGLLGSLAASEAVHRVVAAVDWSALRALLETKGRRLFLEDIAVDAPDHAVSEDAPQADGLRATLRALPPAEARERLTTHVRATVAAVLGAETPGLLEAGQGFFKLGMDSLMTVQLRRLLERSLGVRLPTTIAFEYPTIEALSGYLQGEILGPEIAEGATATPARASGPAGERTDLDDLGEEDLAAMLDGALAELVPAGRRSFS